jgi:hypothetical protein
MPWASLASRSSSMRSTTSSTACARGAELVGEVAQYGDIYRYCYVRGPDDIIIELVEEVR